ncbi:MAG: hypothetical protein ACOYXT_00125 [Bacteroidota bacterium]
MEKETAHLQARIDSIQSVRKDANVSREFQALHEQLKIDSSQFNRMLDIAERNTLLSELEIQIAKKEVIEEQIELLDALQIIANILFGLMLIGLVWLYFKFD